PGSAVLLGNDDAEHSELGHALDQAQVEPVLDVVLDRDREDFVVDEVPNRVLDQALFLRQVEINRRGAYRETAACYATHPPTRLRYRATIDPCLFSGNNLG